MNYFAVSVLLCVAVVEISCGKKYSALNSFLFMNENFPEVEENVHSEYYFGKTCAIEEKTLIAHERFTSKQIRGNIIIRRILNIDKETIPTCVYIKATSPYGDMVRYNAYKFTVCILGIVFNYIDELYYHYYYEWFVPVEMKEGIDWELYFYLA